jgi:hypothetical protein
MRKRNSLIYLFACLGLMSAKAQYVVGFSAQQSGNAVNISFTVLSGNTCNGIDILRSTDSVNFVLAGEIEGVCGSPSDNIYYSFIDEKPVLNADNYYRLDLRQLGYSPVVKVHVYDRSRSLTLFPNPAFTGTSVYFSPDYGRSAALSLFDSRGALLTENSFEGNRYELNAAGLEKGIYLVILRTDKKAELSGYLIKN